MLSKVEKNNMKWLSNLLKSGAEFPSNIGVLCRHTYITYTCGCRYTEVQFQPDTSQKVIRLVGPFCCEKCPSGLPVKLRIFKTDRLYKESEKIIYKGSGIAINLTYEEHDDYFELDS
jgi:hypothetical protein